VCVCVLVLLLGGAGARAVFFFRQRAWTSCTIRNDIDFQLDGGRPGERGGGDVSVEEWTNQHTSLTETNRLLCSLGVVFFFVGFTTTP